MGANLILILWYAIPGAIASAIAYYKGRNVVGWFFGGFFLNIIGIVIVAVIPNLKEQQAQREYTENEHRRLKERLKQEQVKVESFRKHALSRLDAHDAHLGIDTKQLTALPPSYETDPLLLDDETSHESDQTQSTSAFSQTRKWQYQWNQEKHGPISESDLVGKFMTGQLTGSTLVWNDDLTTWTRADDIPMLKERLAA